MKVAGHLQRGALGFLALMLLAVASCVAASPRQSALSRASTQVEFCPGKTVCPGKNKRVKNIQILQQEGARPRWSPQGDVIVFDRKNQDGYYDVYLTDLKGNVVGSLTENKEGVNQRNNGNAVFHPSGDYIVFVSEEEQHAGAAFKWLGDPGLGLFSNLWATTRGGEQFWKLTDVPIKKNILDSKVAMGVINPFFSRNGSVLIWTERYDVGGHHNWGKWRIMTADFVIEDNTPRLENERVLFAPTKGNYVTAMGFLDEQTLLLAGNLDGQHEYGMDQYTFDLDTGEVINLQNSPLVWEEDASILPGSTSIVYMSDVLSKYTLDFNNPNWPAQPREREYWLMDKTGKSREQLTYFNDPSAPEYLGRRVIVAASDFSPDGRFLAGTLGVDFGDKKKAKIELKIVLLEFEKPMTSPTIPVYTECV